MRADPEATDVGDVPLSPSLVTAMADRTDLAIYALEVVSRAPDGQPFGALCAALDVPTHEASKLIDDCLALGYLELAGGRLRLTPDGATLLTAARGRRSAIRPPRFPRTERPAGDGPGRGA